MSAKKKKTKAGISQQGPYKKFLADLNEIVTFVFDDNKRISSMSNELHHNMYDFKYVFQNPKAYNEHVTAEELKIINERSRKLFVERNIEFANQLFSNYQLHVLWCYLTVRAKEIKRKYGENNEDYDLLKESADKTSETFYSRFLMDYFKVITQLSSPDRKYLGIFIGPAALFKDNPKIEIVVEVYGFLPQKSIVSIDGHKRPVFRLAQPSGDTKITWISIDTSLLGNRYTGNKQQLDVYIQSHALKRFRERLDVLNSDAINYLLWENTYTLKNIVVYRDIFLLPVKLYEVKIGYLAGKIVDDMFLFSTFLFITHSFTPEGDRLKTITGLGKQDISYWHIDRLSTFVQLQEEKYPQLIELFDKTGMGDIKELRNKKFDVDSLQDANLEALLVYINKNKKHSKLN